MLKQDSDYYEHFYKDLVPFTHYVPFKHDLSDLLEKIQWARDHDDEVGIFVTDLSIFINQFVHVGTHTLTLPRARH